MKNRDSNLYLENLPKFFYMSKLGSRGSFKNETPFLYIYIWTCGQPHWTPSFNIYIWTHGQPHRTPSFNIYIYEHMANLIGLLKPRHDWFKNFENHSCLGFRSPMRLAMCSYIYWNRVSFLKEPLLPSFDNSFQLQELWAQLKNNGSTSWAH